VSKLGELVIELAANTARLQSDLGKAVGMAERAAGKIKTAFKFAGGGLIGAMLVSSAKQAIEFGDNINKAAVKAGIGSKAMSELAYAAKLADIDIASLSTALKKMQVSLSEASTGAKQPKMALDALGISIADIQKRKPEAQFELLADRISKLQDPADRARAATDLFGKAGADLLPLFEQGAAGIAKARAEAEKLGLSFGDDQIKKLSAADESIKRLDASWKGFAATLTAAVAPALSTVFDRLSGLDTRSTDQKIADLSDSLRPRRGLTAEMRAEGQDRLNKLLGMRELEQVRAAQTGTSGGPTGRVNTSVPIGYGAADAEAARAAAAKKASEEWAKRSESAIDKVRGFVANLNDDMNSMADQTLKAEMERQAQRLDMAEEWYERWADSEKKLAAFREEQAAKLSETAQIWKDATLQAIDDIINTGKVRWDEFAKYLATRLIQTGVSKAFDNLFTGSGGGKKSGGSGLWSGLSSLVGSLFGRGGGNSAASWVDDFRASGGAVQAGKSYLVGERGAEILTMGSAGNITPNNKLGGSSSVVHQTNNFTGGGDVSQIQRMMRESNRQLVEQLTRLHALQGT
jgi:hypothetical protein